MNVGKRIKEAREKLGLSADDIAEALGVDRSTIYRYESNYIEKLPIKILEPLAKVLKTTPGYLMGWKDEDKEKEQPKSEPPLTEHEALLLELSAQLPDEDMNKLIDYALLLKKANNG